MKNNQPPIKTKKTVIIVGYHCNNNCQFCIDSDKRNIVSKTTAQIEQEMAGAKERGLLIWNL